MGERGAEYGELGWGEFASGQAIGFRVGEVWVEEAKDLRFQGSLWDQRQW
jgi:hypothetical protein